MAHTDEHNHAQFVMNIHKTNAELHSKGRDYSSSPLIFNQHQAFFFDRIADWFASEESTPEVVEPKLARIADYPRAYFEEDDHLAILDAGSGTGALIQYLYTSFPMADISAIDLSERQLHYLSQRFPDVKVIQGDIAAYSSPIRYDLIYCNACFGNFFSRTKALQNMQRLLHPGGMVLISHPLGADFVARLNEQDSQTVPHCLPTTRADIEAMGERAGLVVEHCTDEPDFYLCVYRKPTTVRT